MLSTSSQLSLPFSLTLSLSLSILAHTPKLVHSHAHTPPRSYSIKRPESAKTSKDAGFRWGRRRLFEFFVLVSEKDFVIRFLKYLIEGLPKTLKAQDGYSLTLVA